MREAPGTCDARTRSGTACQRPAGWGTDHAGTGRCKLHGGGSAGAPIKHGIYSAKHHERLAARIREHGSNPHPKGLEEELALCRALLAEFLDRFTRDPSADEIDRIGDMAERIARIADRAARIDNQTALTAAELTLLQARFADLALKYVPVEERAAFADDLRALASGRRLALVAG